MTHRLPPSVKNTKAAAHAPGLSAVERRERLSRIPRSYRTAREQSGLDYLRRTTPTRKEAERTRARVEAARLSNKIKAADVARQRARETRPKNLAYKISVPFYARKIPSDTPRLFGRRSNPVWMNEANASLIGRYNAALQSSDAAALDEFIGAVVRDRDGNAYELVTNRNEIRQLINKGQRIEYYKNYRAEAA
jgi:hypothetical protein